MSPAESSISPAPGPVVSLRHGTYEDAQALFSGTLFVAMALMLFNQAGLLIGSTAGMAFCCTTSPTSRSASCSLW